MDPIADMLTIIKNGYRSRRKVVLVPYSKLKEAIARKMQESGFLESVIISEDKRNLKIDLLYEGGEPVVNEIKRISKPSLRIYTDAKGIPTVLRGRGEVILSTTNGILTGREAKKIKSGGEMLLKIW